MSSSEHLFVRSAATVAEEAAFLRSLLHLEPITDPAARADDEVLLRGRARTADGWLGFVVQANYLSETDPEPGEIQAINTYPLMFSIWHGARDPRVQLREARLVFDRMVEARTEVPLLLCQGLTFLTAAYLPGAGVHEFGRQTSIDADDVVAWQPWVGS